MNTRVSLLRPEGEELKQCARGFDCLAWGLGLSMLLVGVLWPIYEIFFGWFLTTASGAVIQRVQNLRALVIGGFDFSGYLLQGYGLLILSRHYPRARPMLLLVGLILLLTWAHYALFIVPINYTLHYAIWIIIGFLHPPYFILLSLLVRHATRLMEAPDLRRAVYWHTGIFFAASAMYYGFVLYLYPPPILLPFFVAGCVLYMFLFFRAARACRAVAGEPSTPEEGPPPS